MKRLDFSSSAELMVSKCCRTLKLPVQLNNTTLLETKVSGWKNIDRGESGKDTQEQRKSHTRSTSMEMADGMDTTR